MMKKILNLFILVVISFLLISCVGEENPTFEFNAQLPTQVYVGDTFTVSAKDAANQAIQSANLSITITSGASLVEVQGLTVTAVTSGAVVVRVTATKDGTPYNKTYHVTILDVPLTYGIPVPQTGFYMRDADVIEEDDQSRYLVYLTNLESGEEDHVIAVRKGVHYPNGHVYGEQSVAVAPSSTGWDQYLGSASIVKGEFSYNSQNYQYLMAYQATQKSNNTSNSIGFAVANDPLGTWTKIGSQPVINYDAAVYGESYAGFYAPSLVNLNQESIIRIFYTWADAFGHFTYFMDFDASDLSQLDFSGFAMVPNKGNLSSGDDATMMPNGDFVYDAEANRFYMIKDYSPSPSQQPRVATRIELAYINEAELYTVESQVGWVSLRLYDMFDTPDAMYERLYSGAIVTDAFGHLIDAAKIEIVYNISDLAADNINHIFSQQLVTIIYEA